MSNRQSSPRRVLTGEAFVTHSLTIRISSGFSEKRMAAFVNARAGNPVVFDRKLVKALDKRIPFPVAVVETYRDALLDLPAVPFVPVLIVGNA